MTIKINMPLKGRISSPFGKRVHPVTKKITFHNGIDIVCKEGTPILADGEGIVIVSKCDNQGVDKGLGYYMDVQYNGYCLRYAHLKQLGLPVKTKVTAKQIIGYSGNTGSSTGAHLHFELRKGKYDSNYLKRDADGKYLNALDPKAHM